MNQIKFHIITPYGNLFSVNEKGEIAKNGTAASSQWILLGIERTNGSEFIPFSELTHKRVAELQMTYKNGNPRYTVRDFDHGATRRWGNTQYHGIKCISFK